MKKKKYRIPHKVNLMDILPFEEVYSWQQGKFSLNFSNVKEGEMEILITAGPQTLTYKALDVTDVLGDIVLAVDELLHLPEESPAGGYRSSDYMRQVIHDTEQGVYVWYFVLSEGLLQLAIWKTMNVDFLETMADMHFDTAKFEEVNNKPAKDLKSGLKLSVAMRPDLFVAPLIEAFNNLRLSYTPQDFRENWTFPYPTEEVAILRQWMGLEKSF